MSANEPLEVPDSAGEEFLVNAASEGLFNDDIPKRIPGFSVHALTKRDYIVRNASIDDLDRLCELETLCWQHTRASRERIRERVERYPQGQFVLVRDGQVLGVVYSQRIADADALLARTADDVHGLHDESGSIIQLLAVNIDPQVQNASYGDQLLEFMLQRCGLMDGIERVVGVTLCKSYDDAQPFDEYIRREGSSQDPVLAFHHAHGADIVNVVPGYRPEDAANQTNGVLVSYDIRNRQPRRGVLASGVHGADVPSADLVSRFLVREAAQLLSIEEALVDVERPVMEMGLDSADLLKLQRLCEERFGVKLQAGFFFEYSTIRKVVDFLAGTRAESAVTVEIAASESDVAVVGMSCKLPGGIENPDDFWRVLVTGECVIGSFPKKRRSWPSSADYPAIDQGGFVHDADAFDAAFFRISPVEAQITDPQQRLLLELAWACFEDAGVPPAGLKGSNTGVFVGASNTDYSRLIAEAGIEIEAHHGIGSSLAILANRISYFFDFSGPSMLIDTACSSSLVALHTAIQSLRSRECATALVGGVNLICHPNLSIAYHKAGMLARDGRCKVFDAKADGYVRAEGAVVLLLKPLQAAIADGNQIHAVIRGSATNHGGLAGGLTVPNPQKQKELLIAAWRDAGIVSQDLTYIEAHGTGTSLGDPIEIQGIAAAYAELSAGDRAAVACGIGSVKSNVGHLESAAGMTGLLKIILSFRNQQLPASVNFSQLNPKIRLDATQLHIQDGLEPWHSSSPRVAAVSSFGSGGTNAHAVVQEYARNLWADCRNDHYLFVLSAATQERLRAYASRVIAWLDSEANDANFADAIYTWQVGRTAMQDRLAIKATDHADLLDKLKQWHAGREVADSWSGQVAQKWSSINRVWQTKSGRQLIDQALLEGDLELLGTLWPTGIEIDWRRYYEGNQIGERMPVIISLPTYPFAKERYWIDAATPMIAQPAAASSIHPLLHENTSDLNEQRFTSRFTGDEFFLADHIVKGSKILPGVCYLEMARAAVTASASESGAIRLRDVVWMSPVTAGEQAQINTALFLDEQGEIGYEIYSNAGTHGQGRASFIDASDRHIDVASLKRGAEQTIDGSRCYAAWSSAGIEYGSALRGLGRVWLGRGYALAEIELPASVADTREQYVLHPSMLDSALQASIALTLDAPRAAQLPYAVDEVEILRNTPARAFVCIRERGDRLRKLDIDVCDDDGRVCARLAGFTSRALEKETESSISLVSLVPHWEPVAPPAGARWPHRSSRILLAGGTPAQQSAIRAEFENVTTEATNDVEHVIWLTPVSNADSVADERLISEQRDGVVSGLQLIRTLLQRGHGSKPLGWTVVTWQTQAITNDERIQPAHAAVHGLIGSLAKEYSHWRIRLVDLPLAGEWPLADVLNLPADERGDAWAYRAGEWYRQQFMKYVPAAAAPVWRDGGVYVVIGGAGGIGEAFSESLIRRHRAQLIWIGRRELDAEIQAKLDRLAALGPAPQYISADATNLDSLTNAYRRIKSQHREIHGLVHAAIVLLDKSLGQMDDARFEAGLAAKVDVSVRLAQVFAQEPLDFVLFFSSLLGFTKPAGQSNYLAGSTFEDAFACELRHAWTCPVKVMNWGYWGSKGIVSSEAYRARMAQNGFASIEPEEGMAALEHVLSAPVSQMALFKGERRGLDGLAIADERMAIASRALPKLAEHLSPQSHRRLADGARQADDVPELQRLMRQLLFAQLQVAGFETTPLHRRWLEESRRVLETFAHDPAELWAEWETRKPEWLGDPNLGAHVRLVDTTLRALPDILTGRRKATDVMFPNASVALVEGIYKHNPVADHFNAIAADAVAEFVEARLMQDRGADIRIIELGAGTGGTSEAVFKCLQPYADRIAEYCYTDLSKAFLMHAEEAYGPSTPYLTYRLLNIEQPLESQGMETGSYDLAIATNVLHATRNIRNTLRNVKATLKRNGVVVLNELLGNSLFMHLTFGLLEGWWLYEDVALRTPGTPLLAPEGWQRALAGEGFEHILFPASASHRHGQQIIAATSDGIIRQKQVAPVTSSRFPGNWQLATGGEIELPVTVQPGIPAQDGSLRERATAALKKIVGATLKLNPQQIDPRAELEQYGIDSILVVKLVNALNGVFDSATATLFFEHRTIDALVGHFLETENEAVVRWLGVAETAPVAIAEPPAPVARRQRARTRAAVAMEAAPSSENPSHDVAIIGLSGRYPQSFDLDALWRNLRDGKDCIGEAPEDRGYRGKGGFIEGVGEFDPQFFNLSPRDAKFIDPQERLFLQHAWMAVEDAGYTRAALRGAEVGVYAGVMYSEYQLLTAGVPDDEVRMGFAGNMASIANRVSYVLDVHGPSMTVDTMCSSSLTAIHVACQDLKSGRTTLAIAGGVNVSVHPNKYRMLSAGQFLAAGGRCQAFGAEGDGFIPAEGVGVVVLKRLADAERDGDHIYGVIRGSSLNHGGKTNGYTVPNPQAQAGAISRALAEANVDARHVSYLEAHGTGTKLGDPIEIAALTKAFSKDTSDTGYCLIGSVKSNIGHCESAAGIAGLTKVLLQMQHHQIVPSLHAAQSNPFIDFDSTPFVVNQALRRWEAPVIDGRTLPRIAGISSFGAGGANAHVIVEEHDPQTAAPVPVSSAAIVLSARTPEQLKQKARELLTYIRPREIELASLAWTLQAGREAMDERFAFVANSMSQVVEKLEAYVAGEQAIDDAHEGQVRRNKEALAVFAIDADLQQTVEKWIVARKLARLLELWVKGLELDWSKLYGEAKPRRISLPAYPFARDRHWIDVTGAAAPRQGTEEHPLLDMARAAMAHLPADETEVEIALRRAGEDVEFEIYSGDTVLYESHPLTSAEEPPASADESPLSSADESPLSADETSAPHVVVPIEPVVRKEIVFLTERRKRGSVALAAPGAETAKTSSAPKARVTLSAASTTSAPVVSPVRLYDCGNGIFSLEIAASRSNDVIDHVLQALDRLQNEPSLKIAIAGGIEHCFVAGGRAPFNEAVERKLFHRLASFAYPTIAVLPGDVIGSGFLAAALCDFMICNEAAYYGFTDREQQLAPAAAEAELFRERFGVAQAEQLLYVHGQSTGRQLREEGWTCPMLPWPEVEAYAMQLASELATKSHDALRLLKQHLSRRIVKLADALTRVDEAEGAIGAHEVAVIGNDDVPRRDPDSEIPVVAALPGSANGQAWLAAQFCDSSVYSTTGVYSARGIENAVPFMHRFGEAAGEIVLSGGDYTGRELQRRIGALLVAEHDQVIPTAKQVAASFAKLPATTIDALKRRPEIELPVTSSQLPGNGQPATGNSITNSEVITTTTHPNGVVIVTMHDHDAKNMFSDALLQGLRDVFARIAQTAEYKVVILTGYDTYFSSGGTRENLVAIQEGKLRFTDLEIFRAALDCPIPVIAAMQGHGIGAGWTLGMFADVVLMSDESRYVSPYMSYGFTPGAGATFVLPAKLGTDLARESLFTGRMYTGAELKKRGVKLHIAPRTGLLATAMSLADEMACSSREHLAALKQQLTADVRRQLDDIVPLELSMHDTTFVGHAGTLAQIESHFRPAPEIERRAPIAPTTNGDVTAALRMLLANELQIAEATIDEQAQFVDLGLDSINAVTWIRKINEKYGTSIEATKVYAYPTLAQLAAHVKQEGSPDAVDITPTPATLADLPPAPVAREVRPTRARRRARKGSEPIAIIGMAGRFPQAANIDAFWRNIAEGRNCITKVPAERWELQRYFREGDPAAGKTNCQWAGTVDDCDRFDPLFFNIAPAEAENMDPQQRLFLEACWHGIEDAGYDATRLSGSKCGVFVGCTVGEYQRRSPEEALSAQGFTGNAMSILAARIAYFLNLQGPCISIDTACSSSLVAIAQACDSLVSGGSDLALAGGVYVMTGPEMHIKTAQAAMLSPDGRCFTFDQRANGFVPGEGVGVVLLKRLSDAERDGDIVHAVIEGWGVNQDGKSNGITAPNPESQTRLEQEVYDRFGIDPASIQLIEAHGTGTKLGDPIEVEGIKAAFRKYTQKTGYCALGSVKSNIGHCLTAAGIAGTLKLALALKHRQLPPTINYERLNEHIELKDTPFFVNDRLQEWALNGAPRRRAAVSSFGFSGTNAHLVVGEYVPAARVEAAAPPQVIVPLSARTLDQLRQKGSELLDFLRTRSPHLADLAYTLQTGRAAMDERLAVVAASLEELAEKLTAWVNGSTPADVFHGQVRRNKDFLGILSDDDDVKEAILDKWLAHGKLSKLAGHWVRGLSFDWNRLYGATKPRRITLPLYPFARERYWIDARPEGRTSAAAPHPLLQRNTSELKELRYTSAFTGAEFFLADHQVGAERVLPGVAYLEMARAAIAQTWPKQCEPELLELRDVVWLKPVVVRGEREVSISLFPQDDRIEYEIHSDQVHCQGEALFSARTAAARLDLEQLRKRMQHARMADVDLYAMFAAMGLHYGHAHQGVRTLHIGAGELLADLRLPAGVATDGFVLHPSMMDSALQASIGLLAEPSRVPDKPPVPFALQSLRLFAPCTNDMAAWVRFADGGSKFDLDLCDAQGNVCIELRGFAVRAMELDAAPAAFDEDFYEQLVADVMSGEVSVDEAMQLT